MGELISELSTLKPRARGISGIENKAGPLGGGERGGAWGRGLGKGAVIVRWVTSEMDLTNDNQQFRD